MNKKEANIVAGVVVDLLVMADSGMADIAERSSIHRKCNALMSLPNVTEWVGYHIEVLEDEDEVTAAAVRAILGQKLEAVAVG